MTDEEREQRQHAAKKALREAFRQRLSQRYGDLPKDAARLLAWHGNPEEPGISWRECRRRHRQLRGEFAPPSARTRAGRRVAGETLLRAVVAARAGDARAVGWLRRRLDVTCEPGQRPHEAAANAGLGQIAEALGVRAAKARAAQVLSPHVAAAAVPAGWSRRERDRWLSDRAEAEMAAREYAAEMREVEATQRDYKEAESASEILRVAMARAGLSAGERTAFEARLRAEAGEESTAAFARRTGRSPSTVRVQVRNAMIKMTATGLSAT